MENENSLPTDDTESPEIQKIKNAFGVFFACLVGQLLMIMFIWKFQMQIGSRRLTGEANGNGSLRPIESTWQVNSEAGAAGLMSAYPPGKQIALIAGPIILVQEG